MNMKLKLKIILFSILFGLVIAMVDPFTSAEVKNFAKDHNITVKQVKDRAKELNMKPDDLVSYCTKLEIISDGIDTYLDENYPDEYYDYQSFED